MTGKAVTSRHKVKCVTCGRRFQSRRRDARNCSGKCRQRAARARATQTDYQRRLDELRREYWATVREAAVAQGVDMSQVVTEQAQTVDDKGNVYVRGRQVGTTTPGRPGWINWGLEAAGPPFVPPPMPSQPRPPRPRRPTTTTT